MSYFLPPAESGPGDPDQTLADRVGQIKHIADTVLANTPSLIPDTKIANELSTQISVLRPELTPDQVQDKASLMLILGVESLKIK